MTLLDKGSSVNAIDKNGRTPLDLAATCSDPKIVQVKQISTIFKKRLRVLAGYFIYFLTLTDPLGERCNSRTR
jgi:hypothetical protein